MKRKKQRIILFLLLLRGAVGHSPQRRGADLRREGDALAALTGTLHLGGEVSVADKWSVEASGYWNPIKTSDISMNFHAVQIGSRYWLYESFVGHFVGGQLSYVGYDLGSRTRRYDGRAYGIGFSYGYAWMLSKRWFVILEARHRIVPHPRHAPRSYGRRLGRRVYLPLPTLDPCAVAVGGVVLLSLLAMNPHKISTCAAVTLCLWTMFGCSVTGNLQRRQATAHLSQLTRAERQERQADARPQIVKLQRDSNTFFLAPVDTLTDGERVMSLRIEQVTVVAKVRSVPERNGRVKLDFIVTLPKELLGRSRSVVVTPVLHKPDGRMALEDLVIRGGRFSLLQERDYWQYATYVERFRPDTVGA